MLVSRNRSNRLDEILNWYGLKCNHNFISLINAIPCNEMWRFFIDGYKQKSGGLAVLLELIEKTRRSNKKSILTFFNSGVSFKKITIRQVSENYNNIPVKIDTLSFYTYAEQIQMYLLNQDPDQFNGWRGNLTTEEKAQPLQRLAQKDCAWIPFEKREPGYLKCMQRAYLYMLDHIDESLSVDLIKHIHSLATGDVAGMCFDASKENKKGDFRYTRSKFGLSCKNSTIDGFKKIINKIRTQRNQMKVIKLETFLTFYVQKHDFNMDTKELCYEDIPINALKEEDDEYNFICTNFKKAMTRDMLNYDLAQVIYDIYVKGDRHKSNLTTLTQPEDENDGGLKLNQVITKTMHDYISNYHSEIHAASSKEKKLEIIITFIQNCEQLHPFLDGNCRVFCMLILNFLLIQNEFPPVILLDPNQFDGYSISELMDSVLDGMENTKNLVTNRKLFDINTNKVISHLSEEERIYFNQIIEMEFAHRNSQFQNRV